MEIYFDKNIVQTIINWVLDHFRNDLVQIPCLFHAGHSLRTFGHLQLYLFLPLTQDKDFIHEKLPIFDYSLLCDPRSFYLEHCLH